MGSYQVEMWWKCLSGNCPKNKGRFTTCQSCGRPRSEECEEGFYDDTTRAAEVTDPEQLQQANAGPNWECAHCHSSQRKLDGSCEQCGSSEAEPEEEEESSVQAEQESPTEVKDQINAAPVEPLIRNPNYFSDFFLLLGALALLSIIPIVLLTPTVKQLIITTQVNAVVTAVSWQHEVKIDRYQVLLKEGFSEDKPSTSFTEENLGKRHHHFDQVWDHSAQVWDHNDQVADGYEDYACTKKVKYEADGTCTKQVNYEVAATCTKRESYDVSGTCTKTVYYDADSTCTKRVKTGETCSKPKCRSNKNGYATCSDPVCTPTYGDRSYSCKVSRTKQVDYACTLTKTRDVDYACTLTKTKDVDYDCKVTKTKDVAATCTRQKYKAVPVYRTEQFYRQESRQADWYRWSYRDWKHNRDLKLSGTTNETRWPSPEETKLNLGLPQGDQERATQVASYKVVYNGGGVNLEYYPEKEEEFRSIMLGSMRWAKITNGKMELLPLK